MPNRRIDHRESFSAPVEAVERIPRGSESVIAEPNVAVILIATTESLEPPTTRFALGCPLVLQPFQFVQVERSGHPSVARMEAGVMSI
jgi:hypothetical protein